MKKKLLFVSLTALLLILTACGSDDDKESADNVEMIDTKVSIPEAIEVGEEVTFQAEVTLGDEKVNDAEYVEFEIWRDGATEEEHQKIDAESKGKGIYEIQHTFTDAGTYSLYAHTQARDMHVMPKKEFEVKDPEADTQASSEEGHSHDQEDEEHSHGDDEGHSYEGEVAAHFVSDKDWKAGEENELMVHLNKDDQPFNDVNVQFEISSDQLEKHLFVDAERTKDGEFTGNYTFPSAGTYTVNVHYENEEIHGHKEEIIEVN
ncbi:FixH family protein [Thalassobacillus hwangdonensis]|uniref:FixH family protein n=1 Tax=Thalassobacillus hwangdonensis TaxID=546108 RepID=A0ABW3L6A5_9BACI